MRDIVQELKRLLDAHPDWAEMLEHSIAEAKAEAVRQKAWGAELLPGDLPGYFKYLHRAVHWIPCENTRREVFYHLCMFYWLLDQPDGKELQKNEEFVVWMRHFADDWGSFLDTPKSAAHLDTFLNDPDYAMWQYQIPPGGFRSFNEFFRRLMKPGLRPVAGATCDRVITSPADSTFQQKFRITPGSEVVVKFTHKYKIADLLEGSPYRDAFAGGLFAHAFLGPNDFHRFAAPVRGTVLECRAIQQAVYLGVDIKDGEWQATDDTDYQFQQTRGLIIQDSPVGLVATLPIGMAQVSSVNMTAVEGSYLEKGGEFGFFQFGGSDIIMLFQGGKGIEYTAAPNVHYNCGMAVAEVVKR